MTLPTHRLDVWFDFASTYAYPALMRIEQLADARGVTLRYRPFLLGPIFADQGWRNSPFNLYPAKGRYMWRDLERLCRSYGLAFRQPEPFPQNSLLAARLTLAMPESARPAFIRAVFMAEFALGLPIAERAILADLLRDLGHDPAPLFERAAQDAIKHKLKSEGDEARRLGIFGAPSFVAEDNELFWGNDRLIEALDWAAEAA